SYKSECVWDWCTLNHMQEAKRPATGVVRKFGEGVPAQVSSDRGSKLRDPSQYSPCVVPKRNVNVTKPNQSSE
ncbi:hypothetical protein AVEN_49590-1, partial [Araneus ventricosus]